MRASCAAGFSVEVIESKSSRRSAVRSSAWLDALRLLRLSVIVWIRVISCAGTDGENALSVNVECDSVDPMGDAYGLI